MFVLIYTRSCHTHIDKTWIIRIFFVKQFLWKVLIYISYITRKELFLMRIYDSKILFHKSVWKLSEGCIYVIRRISSYQKNPKHIRKMVYSEAFDQKGDLQKNELHEVPHSQSLLCTIHGSILKVKLDKTKSERSVDNLKSCWTQTISFLLWWCTCLLRKKAI